MSSFNLLFVLPDAGNKCVLVCKDNHRLPSYTEPVGENVGFDAPHLYNKYFEGSTGIPVYRRYSFNTQKYVVFVCECANGNDFNPGNDYKWLPYDDFITTYLDKEIAEIVQGVKHNYNKSENMPWVNADGFTPYMNWLNDVCAKQGFCITGEITQLKNAYVSTVFCIPTDKSNLYMKIPGSTFITELPFTQGLRALEIVDLPTWIDCNESMNVYLMLDMGGNDLPHRSDICTLQSIISQYANIQKAAILHIPLHFNHYDNTIPTTLRKLRTFAEKSREILQGTPYALSSEETHQLDGQLRAAIPVLESIISISIPNTIHHGDVRQGNIRVVDGQFMFYDWAWGAVSHPFIEIVSFMHIIRNTLPDEAAKEALIDHYIREWLAYGSYDDLKRTFSVLAVLKDVFFAIVDYDWVEAIIQANTESVAPLSADGWLLERRIYYFANVLRRFINTPLVIQGDY